MYLANFLDATFSAFEVTTRRYTKMYIIIRVGKNQKIKEIERRLERTTWHQRENSRAVIRRQISVNNNLNTLK